MNARMTFITRSMSRQLDHQNTKGAITYFFQNRVLTTGGIIEFGAKVAISMVDGYARIEKQDWNPFNENTTLMEAVEGYRPKRAAI